MKEKLHTLSETEKNQKEEKHALEELSLEATAIWEEVRRAESLQNQSHHQVQQLLDLVHEGEKLLKPSEELLK